MNGPNVTARRVAWELAHGRPDLVRLRAADGSSTWSLNATEPWSERSWSGWDGWRCHLYRLAVEPTARRTGIARELALAALDRGARLVAARLDALVDPDNETTVSFWEAMGFDLDADRRWSLPATRLPGRHALP